MIYRAIVDDNNFMVLKGLSQDAFYCIDNTMTTIISWNNN